MYEGEIEPLTLKDVAAIYRRWYKLAIYTFIGLIVPAVIVIFLILPMYEATASIWINRLGPSTDYSVGVHNATSTTTFRNLDRQEEIATHSEMLKARVIVEAMVDKLDLSLDKLNRIRDARRYVQAVIDGVLDGSRYIYNELKYLLGLGTRPTPEEVKFLTRVKLIDDVVERVSVTALSDSNVLGVSFRSSDPVLAKEAVNVIVDEFVNFYGNIKEVNAKNFFAEVAEEMGEELLKTEQELLELQSRTADYAIKQQQGLLLNQLSEAEEKLRSLEIFKAQLTGRIQIYKDRLAVEPKKIIAREVMKKTPTGNIKDRTTWELNPIYQKLRMQLMNSEIEISALDKQEAMIHRLLGEYRDKLAAMGKVDLRVKQLQRKITNLENTYSRSIENRDKAQIIEEMSQASLSTVRIVDYAPYPLKPIRPRKLFYLMIVLGASLLIALAMPFLAHLNDSSILDENDVRHYLGIDFVANLPLIKHSEKT